MALNSYARLRVNGTALDGDTMLQQIGGVDVSSDHLEVYEVRWGSGVPAATVTGRPGRLEMQPILITKRVDQATPRLYQALATNAAVDGDIKLFETHPQDGTSRHRFTLVIAKARIQSIASCSPDTLDAALSTRPAREVVAIAATSVTYRDEVHSVEYQQDVSAR